MSGELAGGTAADPEDRHRGSGEGPSAPMTRALTTACRRSGTAIRMDPLVPTIAAGITWRVDGAAVGTVVSAPAGTDPSSQMSLMHGAHGAAVGAHAHGR